MEGQLQIFLPSEKYGHDTGVLVDFMNDLVVNAEVQVRTAYNYYMVVRSLAKHLSKQRNGLDADVDEIELGYVAPEFMLDLSEDEWNDYLGYYCTQKLEKANSMAFRITVFRRFYKWLSEKMNSSPPTFVMTARRPAHIVKKPRPVPASAMHEIVRCMRGKTRMRDICIVTLAYECGLGIDELSSLQMEDLERERIRVRSDSGRIRFVPLSPAAQKALDLYLPTRIPPLDGGNPLFVSIKRGPLGRTAVYMLLAKAVNRSTNLDRSICFRDLQQSWAIRMSKENVEEMPETSRISSSWYLDRKIDFIRDFGSPANK